MSVREWYPIVDSFSVHVMRTVNLNKVCTFFFDMHRLFPNGVQTTTLKEKAKSQGINLASMLLTCYRKAGVLTEIHRSKYDRTYLISADEDKIKNALLFAKTQRKKNCVQARKVRVYNATHVEKQILTVQEAIMFLEQKGYVCIKKESGIVIQITKTIKV